MPDIRLLISEYDVKSQIPLTLNISPLYSSAYSNFESVFIPSFEWEQRGWRERHLYPIYSRIRSMVSSTKTAKELQIQYSSTYGSELSNYKSGSFVNTALWSIFLLAPYQYRLNTLNSLKSQLPLELSINTVTSSSNSPHCSNWLGFNSYWLYLYLSPQKIRNLYMQLSAKQQTQLQIVTEEVFSSSSRYTTQQKTVDFSEILYNAFAQKQNEIFLIYCESVYSPQRSVYNTESFNEIVHWQNKTLDPLQVRIIYYNQPAKRTWLLRFNVDSVASEQSSVYTTSTFVHSQDWRNKQLYRVSFRNFDRLLTETFQSKRNTALVIITRSVRSWHSSNYRSTEYKNELTIRMWYLRNIVNFILRRAILNLIIQYQKGNEDFNIERESIYTAAFSQYSALPFNGNHYWKELSIYPVGLRLLLDSKNTSTRASINTNSVYTAYNSNYKTSQFQGNYYWTNLSIYPLGLRLLLDSVNTSRKASIMTNSIYTSYSSNYRTSEFTTNPLLWTGYVLQNILFRMFIFNIYEQYAEKTSKILEINKNSVYAPSSSYSTQSFIGTGLWFGTVMRSIIRKQLPAVQYEDSYVIAPSVRKYNVKYARIEGDDLIISIPNYAPFEGRFYATLQLIDEFGDATSTSVSTKLSTAGFKVIWPNGDFKLRQSTFIYSGNDISINLPDVIEMEIQESGAPVIGEPESKLRKVIFYDGYPTYISFAFGDVNFAANFYKQFDDIVFSELVIDPLHPEYDKLNQLFSKIKSYNPDARIWGSLSASLYQSNKSQFLTHLANWAGFGCSGINVKDILSVPEQLRTEIFQAVHEYNMRVAVTVWNARDIFESAVKSVWWGNWDVIIQESTPFYLSSDEVKMLTDWDLFERPKIINHTYKQFNALVWNVASWDWSRTLSFEEEYEHAYYFAMLWAYFTSATGFAIKGPSYDVAYRPLPDVFNFTNYKSNEPFKVAVSNNYRTFELSTPIGTLQHTSRTNVPSFRHTKFGGIAEYFNLLPHEKFERITIVNRLAITKIPALILEDLNIDFEMAQPTMLAEVPIKLETEHYLAVDLRSLDVQQLTIEAINVQVYNIVNNEVVVVEPSAGQIQISNPKWLVFKKQSDNAIVFLK